MSKKIKHNCRNCAHSVFDPITPPHGTYRCYKPGYPKGMYDRHSPKDSCDAWTQKSIDDKNIFEKELVQS